MQFVALLSGLAAVSAFAPASLRSAPVTRAAAPTMEASFPRRELVSKVMGTAAMLGAAAANAEVDYAGVGFLGGSNIIDVNNANIRVYIKLQGMYPNAATKLVKFAPYKNAAEIYTKAGLTSTEAATIKKYESRFIFLEPKPEYVVDMLNNGLYR